MISVLFDRLVKLLIIFMILFLLDAFSNKITNSSPPILAIVSESRIVYFKREATSINT